MEHKKIDKPKYGIIHYILIILGAIWLTEVAAVTYAVVKIIEFVEG